MFIHSLDRDKSCAIQGNNAEVSFKMILEKEGYTVRQATSYENRVEHVDLFATKNNKTIRIDIKSAKRISRADKEPNLDYVWVEILGVDSSPGWLYGGTADFVTFDIGNRFAVVPRESLKTFVRDTCNMRKFVNKPEDALYSNYRRFGRGDSLSLIKREDVEKLAEKIYLKTV